MKRKLFAYLTCLAILVGVFTVPVSGGKTAAQVVAAAARDLTAHDAALQEVNTEAANWSAAVANSDAALAALQSAQSDFDAAVTAEAAARGAYEAAQSAFQTEYSNVPKEDSLMP